tara:strand:- start:272 stop:586 length:315 start_codon:yes stop_codon:yes gene_type:complete
MIFDYIPDGTLFGLLDNGIVLVGMYLGVDIEGWVAKRLDKKSNPLLGAVIGATGFNTISDGAAAAIDPSMQGMTFGVMLGCVSVMILIPIAESIRYKKDSKKIK